jgi:co-chaperonin GroES (HSP10)
MSNDSGLFPVGRAVLVEPYQPERKMGLIQLPDEVLGREQMIEQRAVVVAIGPSAWFDEPQPRAKVGDRVLISKFAGHMAKGTLDDKQYRFINDRDIFAIITEE